MFGGVDMLQGAYPLCVGDGTRSPQNHWAACSLHDMLI